MRPEDLERLKEAAARLAAECDTPEKVRAYLKEIGFVEEPVQVQDESAYFNYCVAHYWREDRQSIGTYTFGREVHYGTMEDAEEFLAYVKRQSPEHEWQIFKVVPIAV